MNIVHPKQDGIYRTESSSSNQTTYTVVETQKFNSQNNSGEIVAWILVAVLSVLLTVSLVIHVMQAVWTIRRGRSADRNLNTPPDCTLAIANDPSYGASNVKLYSEVQEAVHLYETLKQ